MANNLISNPAKRKKTAKATRTRSTPTTRSTTRSTESPRSRPAVKSKPKPRPAPSAKAISVNELVNNEVKRELREIKNEIRDLKNSNEKSKSTYRLHDDRGERTYYVDDNHRSEDENYRVVSRKSAKRNAHIEVPIITGQHLNESDRARYKGSKVKIVLPTVDLDDFRREEND